MKLIIVNDRLYIAKRWTNYSYRTALRTIEDRNAVLAVANTACVAIRPWCSISTGEQVKLVRGEYLGGALRNAGIILSDILAVIECRWGWTQESGKEPVPIADLAIYQRYRWLTLFINPVAAEHIEFEGGWALHESGEWLKTETAMNCIVGVKTGPPGVLRISYAAEWLPKIYHTEEGGAACTE